jgi:biotin carboxyl carrier protein
MAESTPSPSPLPALPTEAWTQIAGWLAQADVDCIELAAPGRLLRMVRTARGYQLHEAPAPAPGPVAHAAVGVVAPCAGILLDRHPTGDRRLAQPGERVGAGDLVALLQIGLVLAPVVAPFAGTITSRCVAAGAPVGFGTRLLEITVGDA